MEVTDGLMESIQIKKPFPSTISLMQASISYFFTQSGANKNITMKFMRLFSVIKQLIFWKESHLTRKKECCKNLARTWHRKKEN
jgi:hypothetical protein